MLIALQKERFWLIANALGLLLYVYLDSKVWLPPGLTRDEVAIGPEAITWFTTAGPVLLLFVLADSIWLGLLGKEALRARGWGRTSVAFAVALAWLCALELGRIHN